MRAPHSWRLGVIGLLIIAAIPVIAHRLRGNSNRGCQWDGRLIDNSYRVKVVNGESTHTFCGISCARNWLAKGQFGGALSVFVTDEESGELIEASSATFARSTVVTNEVTGNRIHVFKDRGSAQRHIEAFRGQILDTSPLQIEEL